MSNNQIEKSIKLKFEHKLITFSLSKIRSVITDQHD